MVQAFPTFCPLVGWLGDKTAAEPGGPGPAEPPAGFWQEGPTEAKINKQSLNNKYQQNKKAKIGKINSKS